MHVLVSSTFSASRSAADGGDADDGVAAARGGSPWLGARCEVIRVPVMLMEIQPNAW